MGQPVQSNCCLEYSAFAGSKLSGAAINALIGYGVAAVTGIVNPLNAVVFVLTESVIQSLMDLGVSAGLDCCMSHPDQAALKSTLKTVASIVTFLVSTGISLSIMAAVGIEMTFTAAIVLSALVLAVNLVAMVAIGCCVLCCIGGVVVAANT
jgi:hypothetical protein